MLKLQPDPTFWAKVTIPLPGGSNGEVKMEFVHMDSEQLEKYTTDRGSVNDAAAVLKIAKGWDNEETFDEVHVGKFLKNYMGAGRAIARTFVEELMQVRVGN